MQEHEAVWDEVKGLEWARSVDTRRAVNERTKHMGRAILEFLGCRAAKEMPTRRLNVKRLTSATVTAQSTRGYNEGKSGRKKSSAQEGTLLKDWSGDSPDTI